MTMTIKTKDNGKTTVRINAATIAEAIRKLDHARTALCEMDNAFSSEAHLLEQVRSEEEQTPRPERAQDGTPFDIPLSSDDPDDAPPPTVEELRADINANGKQLFPNAWDKACPWLIGLWTTKNTPTDQRNDLNQLNAEECTQLLCGMIEHAPYLQTEWQKHLQNETAKAPQAATKSSTQRPKSRTTVTPGANGRLVAERF